MIHDYDFDEETPQNLKLIRFTLLSCHIVSCTLHLVNHVSMYVLAAHHSTLAGFTIRASCQTFFDFRSHSAGSQWEVSHRAHPLQVV